MVTKKLMIQLIFRKFNESSSMNFECVGSCINKTNYLTEIHGDCNTYCIPGTRYGSSLWQTSDGLVWMFGGSGISQPQNDLWTFAPNSAKWGLINICTDNQEHYSSLNTILVTNCPPPIQNALYWLGADDSLYIYGGKDSGTYSS